MGNWHHTRQALTAWLEQRWCTYIGSFVPAPFDTSLQCAQFVPATLIIFTGCGCTSGCMCGCMCGRGYTCWWLRGPSSAIHCRSSAAQAVPRVLADRCEGLRRRSKSICNLCFVRAHNIAANGGSVVHFGSRVERARGPLAGQYRMPRYIYGYIGKRSNFSHLNSRLCRSS